MTRKRAYRWVSSSPTPAVMSSQEAAGGARCSRCRRERSRLRPGWGQQLRPPGQVLGPGPSRLPLTCEPGRQRQLHSDRLQEGRVAAEGQAQQGTHGCLGLPQEGSQLPASHVYHLQWTGALSICLLGNPAASAQPTHTCMDTRRGS